MPDPERDRELLKEAFDRLEAETPERVTRMIRWLRHPHSRWVRLPAGMLCIISGFFFFLPIIGLHFFPIGLLLIAQDVPFLRGPVARWMLRLEDRWMALQAWRAARRRRR